MKTIKSILDIVTGNSNQARAPSEKSEVSKYSSKVESHIRLTEVVISAFTCV